MTFERADLRRELPDREFDLILCRNLAFSYFELPEQSAILQQFLKRLSPHGALVIGLNEQLPDGHGSLRPVPGSAYIFRRSGVLANEREHAGAAHPDQGGSAELAEQER